MSMRMKPLAQVRVPITYTYFKLKKINQALPWSSSSSSIIVVVVVAVVVVAGGLGIGEAF